jgi:hypothetical protein
MDHHEQHHQKHRKEREHEKHEHKLREQEAERKDFLPFHPAWLVGICFALVLIAVLIWTVFLS